jgi:hypothetical protein
MGQGNIEGLGNKQRDGGQEGIRNKNTIEHTRVPSEYPGANLLALLECNERTVHTTSSTHARIIRVRPIFSMIEVVCVVLC